jgi:hypothetical protein
VGTLNISTIIVTGCLANIATELTNVAFILYDNHTASRAGSSIKGPLKRAGILSGIWLLYLMGAMLGEVVYRRIEL